MDSGTILGAIFAGISAAGVVGGGCAWVVILIVKGETRELSTRISTIAQTAQMHTDSVRREMESLLGRKLAEHADDMMRRVNGAYMRGPEQRMKNDHFSEELSEIKGCISKMQLDMGHLTTSLARLSIEDFRRDRASSGA